MMVRSLGRVGIMGWRRFVVMTALLLHPAAALAQSRAPAPRGFVYTDVAPMRRTVADRIAPALTLLTDRLIAERRAMTLGGRNVFEGGDKFLPGKIAIILSYRVLATRVDTPARATELANFRGIAALTIDDPNDSWGEYYYLLALYRLDKAGLLADAVDPATLAKLKVKLDWRRFVRPDLTLIDLPNNYYGVAFSVARLRHLLGWEDAAASDALLQRMIAHYRRYSGAYGFADETDGDGRFDRYSVLLIGEIAQRFIETGTKPTPEILGWLRKSVDLLLPRLNLRGEGFEYGRSIGPYGETAFVEVLSAAAKLGVLTPVETRMAYAYSSRVAARYADFWLDPTMSSVNMWEQGRHTDDYRAEHRMFGENLSLARQFLYTSALWDDLGLGTASVDPGYAAWLDTLPRATLTWFARGEQDRALVTIRDRGRVIGLPLVGGGTPYHRQCLCARALLAGDACGGARCALAATGAAVPPGRRHDARACVLLQRHFGAARGCDDARRLASGRARPRRWQCAGRRPAPARHHPIQLLPRHDPPRRPLHPDRADRSRRHCADARQLLGWD